MSLIIEQATIAKASFIPGRTSHRNRLELVIESFEDDFEIIACGQQTINSLLRVFNEQLSIDNLVGERARIEIDCCKNFKKISRIISFIGNNCVYVIDGEVV